MESDDDNQESDEAEVSIITRPSTAGVIGIDDNTQGSYTNSSSAINNTDQAAGRNVQEHTTGHGQSTAGSQGFSRSHSKHLIGYDRNWESEFSWLEVVTDDKGKAVGMLCKLCRKHTENKYNHSKVWNETPCVCMRKDSVRCHFNSEMHVTAVQLETVRQAADANGGIGQAFQAQVSLQHAAVKGAMQSLYWLVKSEIPHTNHYCSLIEAMKFIGCDVFKHLHHGENAKYTSQRIIQEFLNVMGKQLRESQLTELCDCDHYSIMIDESTDVSVIKELVIYA